MSTYLAKRIFIASPSDLNEERKTFVDIISEVNIIKAHSMGMHLEPLGWEETLPGKGRPQELINKDLSKSDLFVMLLWKKWGTPTGKYSSGTEEEFYVASTLYSQFGVPDIWIFFKTLTEEDNQENADIQKIVQFRKKIEKENSYLYKTFGTTLEWEKLFRSLLCKWLDNLPTSSEVKEKPSDLTKNNILIEISFVDWIRGDSKAEIYFTIKDHASFISWLKLSDDQKKQYLYNQLSQHLYLIIGCDPYTAVMRYKIDDNRYILLGIISFHYGETLEQSRIYIPIELNQIVTQNDIEKRLIDFWA